MMSRYIQETRCTCKACGNVWYFGKEEVTVQTANALNNCGKSMMCCTGCAPALLIPDKPMIDLNQCPKCNSRAVEREVVTHEVD